MPASGLQPPYLVALAPLGTPVSAPTSCPTAEDGELICTQGPEEHAWGHRQPFPGCAHHARALAVTDLRVEPGQRSEDPAQPRHPDAAHAGEAGIAGHRAEQVLLDLPVAHDRSRETQAQSPGGSLGGPMWGTPQWASLLGTGVPRAPPFRIRAQLVCS